MNVGSARSLTIGGQVSIQIGERVVVGTNLVVDTAQKVLVGLFSRDPGFSPKYVVVGDGGDLDQQLLIDSGARVPPAAADTQVRSEVARVPITEITQIDATTWRYTAVADRSLAVSPAINELGLLTDNGTLLAHYVTNAPNPGARATKYAKTSSEYMILTWTLSLALL